MAKWVNLDDCIEISVGDMNFYPVELLGDIYEEVLPVIHAHWIFYANGTCDCSNCHTVWESNMLNRWIEYCPFCGAKMDEGERRLDHGNY